MKEAYIFPGQGSQFEGMAKELLEQGSKAEEMLHEANELLGFDIQQVMTEGSLDDLTQTKVTQPAIYIHSCITYTTADVPEPDMVAGHSLGEYSALFAAKAISYADGLRMVQVRADAMQRACEDRPSTMAAILGLPDDTVETVCLSIIDEVVLPANYNSPGQVVISGTIKGVEEAMEKLKEAGAKRCIKLNVGGAFHSPLMQSAQDELEEIINSTDFKTPTCPVYQNVPARGVQNPEEIKFNLITQLTAPVKWTQSVQQMKKDGAENFTEFGPGKVLTGLVRKIN